MYGNLFATEQRLTHFHRPLGYFSITDCIGSLVWVTRYKNLVRLENCGFLYAGFNASHIFTARISLMLVFTSRVLLGPKSGKEVIIEIDGQHVPGCTSQIPRADVATFMLKAMQGQEYDKTMLAIGIK